MQSHGHNLIFHTVRMLTQKTVHQGKSWIHDGCRIRCAYIHILVRHFCHLRPTNAQIPVLQADVFQSRIQHSTSKHEPEKSNKIGFKVETSLQESYLVASGDNSSTHLFRRSPNTIFLNRVPKRVLNAGIRSMVDIAVSIMGNSTDGLDAVINNIYENGLPFHQKKWKPCASKTSVQCIRGCNTNMTSWMTCQSCSDRDHDTLLFCMKCTIAPL